MLLEFRVCNYRSIGEEQVLSLIPASKQKDHLQNILTKGKYQALNAISLYGQNGSGKSNLLLAMSFLDKLIHISARTSSTTKLPYDPFLLREGWEGKPTRFEITFIIEENRYRYGLEFTEKEVLKEWLFRKSQSREVSLFEREESTIEVSSGFNGSKKIIDAAIEATRDNALFLSTCDMLNVEEAKIIFNWFRYFGMIDGLNTEDLHTVDLWDKEDYKDKIKKYLESLSLNIADVDITTKDFDESELPDDMPKAMKNRLAKSLKGKQSYTVIAKHTLYDSNAKPTPNLVSWEWWEKESAGSKKAFELSGPILWTLANGGVLIIDEIEAKMHPVMTLNTIDIFLDPASNPNKAQLIFATHDTNLLTYSTLRRDQIYFVEKNKWESSELYSLSDFVYFENKNGEFKSEKERPDTDKEKRYFEGRYKAIPVLGDFRTFIRNTKWQKEVL
ncbi:AAA family ATPase [Foetidibacter luteolus]|uniref:AAA family ATPase n=1 Tax=Foetidibacter luteolus TaxID=2608880 RepID=UPI00129BD6AA|nr:ATP-binding protein [Foetidibacter luteolus]